MRTVICVLAVAIVVGGLGWWKHQENQAMGDTLILYGNVEIRQVQVAFRVGGRIVDMAVEEGALIEKGAFLARLDPIPAKEIVRRAQEEVAVQEAELAKLRFGYQKEDIEQARASLVAAQAALVNATSNFNRIEKLRAQRAIAQKELDEARAAYTEAASRRNAAREQLRLLEGGYRVEDIARQEAAVGVAQAALATALTHLEDTTLIAPQSGTILTRIHEIGAVVQAGQPVYAITLSDPVWIRAYVTQPNLGRLRPGQAVQLSIDAMPGKAYPGTIGFISPTAEFTPKTVETRDVRNDLVFRFRVVARDPDNVMRQGMPVTVTLIK